jgi:hypothetical protein
MRDRMILYRDQFDLDDCFRCLLSGSVFHGGDPAIAGNWQLPAEFFEKYWFLTTDYNLRRYTNEWRKLQGLKEIQDIPQQTATTSPPSLSSLNMASPPPPLQQQFSHQQPQQHIQNEPPNHPSGNLSYEDLSGYLGVQLKDTMQQQQPQQEQQQQQDTNLTPIQLTNGYGMMNTANSTDTTTAAASTKSIPHTQQQTPWQSFMTGQKNYGKPAVALDIKKKGIND